MEDKGSIFFYVIAWIILGLYFKIIEQCLKLSQQAFPFVKLNKIIFKAKFDMEKARTIEKDVGYSY